MITTILVSLKIKIKLFFIDENVTANVSLNRNQHETLKLIEDI